MIYRQFHAVSEHGGRREYSVDAAGADRYNPRRRIGKRRRGGAGVAGAARDDDVSAGGVEGADGYAVLGEGLGLRGPDRDAEHVDAVGDGVVDGSEHVLLEAGVAVLLAVAGDGPAHLVHGHACQRRAT